MTLVRSSSENCRSAVGPSTMMMPTATVPSRYALVGASAARSALAPAGIGTTVVQSGMSHGSPARGRFRLAVRNSRDSRRRKADRPRRSTSVSPPGARSIARAGGASAPSLGAATICTRPYRWMTAPGPVADACAARAAVSSTALSLTSMSPAIAILLARARLRVSARAPTCCEPGAPTAPPEGSPIATESRRRAQSRAAGNVGHWRPVQCKRDASDPRVSSRRSGRPREE